MSEHHFKLSAKSPQKQTAGGMRFEANSKNFSVLKGMSLYKLVLYPKGLREPHWHANADELGYCLQGRVLVTLYDTGDVRQSFLVETGDAFFVPSGALHYIENVGDTLAELLLNFSHEEAEDFNLSSVLGAFSNAVLGNTWQVSEKAFEKLPRSPKQSAFASLLKVSSIATDEERYKSAYRFSLAQSKPLISNAGGLARMARQNVWPIVKRQALYSLVLTDKGMREPHWHPETQELGYVESGKGRMSIMLSDGRVDTYIMEAGDIYFVPKAYPHHIENLGESNLRLHIFFDQPMPKDIGLTASVGAYADAVLASATNSEACLFQSLNKYYANLFIVNRLNPLD